MGRGRRPRRRPRRPKRKQQPGRTAADEKSEEKEKEEEDKEEKDEKADMDIDVPVEEVSLTEEEKALKFRKKDIPDMTTKDVSTSFSKFALPGPDEGFDSIDFVWQPQDVCQS